MRLSRNELIAKLSLGEDSLLECKDVRFSGASVRGPSQNDLADELVAFASLGRRPTSLSRNRSGQANGVVLDVPIPDRWPH